MNDSYRRITAGLLAAGMIVIPSCGKKDPAARSSSSAAETPAVTASETDPGSSESLPAPVFANSAQLEVIFAAKSTWFVEGDNEMRYAITDLDMNGRYEITAAKKNSSFNMYEVTADNSGIAKVEDPFEDGSSGPYMEDEYNLRVSKNGTYVYVAREYDDSMAPDQEVTTYYLMSLSEGKLKAETIANMIKEADGSVRYGDDDFEMSAEEFKAKTDKDLPKIEHTLKVSWGDGKTVSGMNDAKSLEGICFKLTK